MQAFADAGADPGGWGGGGGWWMEWLPTPLWSHKDDVLEPDSDDWTVSFLGPTACMFTLL